MSRPDLLRGVGRAFGGALLFALPILMTMEVWRIGVTVPRYRLALLVVATVVLTVGLARYFGFLRRSAVSWPDALVDAGVALLVGATAAGVVLWLLSVIRPLSSWRDAVSIVAIEALPATIGASFARSQLGGGQSPRPASPPYAQELFLMTAGAVVFAANIAPTEEVVLLAARMSELDALLLAGLELALLHAFVYGVDFTGGSRGLGFWPAFSAYTTVGFLLALGVSAYLLWTFGRFDGTGLLPALTQCVVLALPASLGAAAARLIL